MKAMHGVEAVLVGVNDESAFEVEVNDTLVFSKAKEGRFPLHHEILSIIERQLKMT